MCIGPLAVNAPAGSGFLPRIPEAIRVEVPEGFLRSNSRMAAIVGVLDWHQPVTASPTSFKKRHEANRLCRRGWAEKIRRDLIRMRRQREFPSPVRLHLGYIPHALPPVEVSGCTYDGPRPDHQSLYIARARLLAGCGALKPLAGSRKFIGYVEGGKKPVSREVLASEELQTGKM